MFADVGKELPCATVRTYGTILATDHLRLFYQILPALQSAGLGVPGLSQQNLQNIQQFSSLTGQKFDNQFTSFMVQDHIQDMLIGMAEEQVGTDPSARLYAAQAVPVLVTHLLIALALQPGGQQSNSSSQS